MANLKTGNMIGKKILRILANIAMLLLGIVQLFDFIFTSLSIQDWLGTGNTFKWAPAEAFLHFKDLQSSSNTHVIDQVELHHEESLSKYGYMIMDAYGNHPEEYLWASIGYFENAEEDTDMCRDFVGHYEDVYKTRNRLLLTREKMTLVNPLSMLSDEELKSQETKNKKSPPHKYELEELEGFLENGHVGSRRAVEIRMSARVDFDDYWDKDECHKDVKAIRFYAKSFCDGCDPVAELGQMFCAMDIKLTDGRTKDLKNIEVVKSYKRAGSKHRMGLAMPSTNNDYIVTVIRIAILIYVLHAYLNILTNSSKSNEERYFMYKQEGADAATLMSSKVQRPFLQEFFMPDQNICRASPFSISFLMYNSDAIVMANLIIVVFTFMASLIIKDEVVWWSHYDETFRGVITRIGVNAKMMWLYIAVIKFIKHVCIKMRLNRITILMSFHSHIFVTFFIIYLVLLSVTGYDFLLDALFHDRIDIVNDFTLMNDVTVLFELGFYVQRLPAIFVHTIVTSVVALVLLIVLQQLSGTTRRQHSFYRTFACCHSTLIWDPNMFEKSVDDAQGTDISIGTLMNIKWMLKVHTMTYPIFDLNNDKKNQIASADSTSTASADNAARVEIGTDGALHIILKSNSMDLEQTLVYYKWLQSNRSLRIY